VGRGTFGRSIGRRETQAADAIHAGSQYRGAPSSIGWPSYRYEYYLAEAQRSGQVLSLIYEGVFGNSRSRSC